MTKIIMRDIAKAACINFQIEYADLFSDRRIWKVSHPRQIAMILCRDLTRNSLPQIGAFFGGKDHTTVIHAIREMGALIAGDPEWAAHKHAIAAVANRVAKIRCDLEAEWVDRLHRGEFVFGEARPKPIVVRAAPPPVTYDPRLFIERKQMAGR